MPSETETTTNISMGEFIALMESRGRTVLGAYDIPEGYIVLCISSTSVQPYVTWAADTEGNTFWGHYFDVRAEAEADFAKRIGKGY